MIIEPDKKISVTSWRKELASIEAQIEKSKQPYAETVCLLASVEVLEHNRKNLERLLANEKSAREKAQNLTQKRNNQSL